MRLAFLRTTEEPDGKAEGKPGERGRRDNFYCELDSFGIRHSRLRFSQPMDSPMRLAVTSTESMMFQERLIATMPTDDAKSLI